MKDFKIYVTSPCFDNIGKVLDSLKISYAPFKNKYDCDILFLNCGTSDSINDTMLNQFVKKGGILYASDLTSSQVSRAFPKIFGFIGDVGTPCTMSALVVDAELRNIMGSQIDIVFDMSSWSVLKHIELGQVILQSAVTNYPLMVMIPVGQGKVFYTCFHNHAQANEKEQILLKLLVLKQLSEVSTSSIEKVSEVLNVNLSDFKNKFGIFDSPTKPQNVNEAQSWDDFFTNQKSQSTEGKSPSADDWNF